MAAAKQKRVKPMVDLYYRVIEHCEGSYYKAPKNSYLDLGYAAQQCAEDYFDESIGWDDWDQGESLTFTLHDGENGPELGRYSISYDVSPDFSVREEKHVPPAA